MTFEGWSVAAMLVFIIGLLTTLWVVESKRHDRTREKWQGLVKLWFSSNFIRPLVPALEEFYQGQKEAVNLKDVVPDWVPAQLQGLLRDPLVQSLMADAIVAWEKKYPDMEITFPGVEPPSEPWLTVGWKLGWVWVCQDSTGKEIMRGGKPTREYAFMPNSGGGYTAYGLKANGVAKVIIQGPSGKVWGEFSLDGMKVTSAPAPEAA